MHVSALVLLQMALAGGPLPPPSGHHLATARPEARAIFDVRDGRSLVGQSKDLADSSPFLSSFALYEESRRGARLLARRVGHAAFASDGSILYVQDDGLFALAGEERKLLARGVAPDFALSPDGSQLAVVRSGDRAGGSAIDLLPRVGGSSRQLVEPIGLNGTPVFTPDGKALIFSSTRTGIASFFRVELDGSGLRQLTNVGLRVGTGAVFGPSFVPPAENRHELRFVGARTLEYRGAGGLWRLDVVSGKARAPEARQ